MNTSRSWMCTLVVSISAAVLLLLTTGCGFQATPIPVLSPGSATVNVSATQQFSIASLLGGTAWSVDGQLGGTPATGTISATGLYTAPLVPPTVPVVVTASSAEVAGINVSAIVKVVNPAPELTRVSPEITVGTTQPLTITVSGHDFTPQSVVSAGGNAAQTTFVSESKLQATIPADEVQQAANLQVAVSTPAPGGGRSANQTIQIVASGTVIATDNPLVAQYGISAPRDGAVTVEFGPGLNYGRETWTKPLPQGGGSLSLLVAGMRANSLYHMRARIDLAGTTLYDTDHTFTTGGLPPGIAPPITVTQTQGAVNGGGVDLVSTNSALVLDTDGSVIWYYPGRAFPVRECQDGNFLLIDGSTARQVDLAGHTLRDVALNDLNAALAAEGYTFQVETLHHDAIELPDGHWILLGNEQQQFQDLPGYPGTTTVTGDDLIDVDQNNTPVWVWRAFDHLDINRHPWMFPDWTHANAIVYTQDHDLLLSLRHQSWILKIDYADGKGTGDVLWRLGADGDFSLAGGDPTQWFYSQHYPKLFGVQLPKFTVGMYDNGNARPDSSGQLCVYVGTCYSRALIMNVDESARTAEIAWEYSPGWFDNWGGSISQLPNGDVEFDSSTVNTGPSSVLEVTPGPTPTIVWRMDMQDGSEYFYRAYRISSLYPGVQW